MDAIALLKKDHGEVKRLFKFLLAQEEADARTIDALFRQLRRELAVHADIEEQLFYPTLRERVPSLEDDVLEALEEHHVAKVSLAELDALSTDDERFHAKLTVLREYLYHHIREEERTLFPKLRTALTRHELDDLGRRLAQAKRIAPTRPHPMAPDQPPANRANVLTAVLDRARDLVETVVTGARSMRPLRSRM